MDRQRKELAVRRILYALLLVAALPWFVLSGVDTYHELVSPGTTADAPHKFAALAFVELFVPLTIVCLAIACPLTIYFVIRGPSATRFHVLLWVGVLAVGVGAAVSWISPGFFAQRAVYDGIEVIFFGILVILPLVWIVTIKDRPRNEEKPPGSTTRKE